MKSSFLVIYIILSISGLINAWVYPTSPDSNSVFKPDSVIKVQWKDDNKPQNIASVPKLKVFFMSGSDQEQIYLATVGEVPGSQLTIDYPCPQVDPVGKWYFFRFSDGNTTNDAYTTRFTISDSNGNYPPAQSPAPAPGKNPGQNGKIVSNSTTPAATSSISGGTPTSTPASSNNNSNVPATNAVPSTQSSPSAPSAQKTQSSNANPNKQSAGPGSNSATSDSASSNKTSKASSGASSSASLLGCAKELAFSVIVGFTLSFLMPSI
ncbi:hypothetical protein C2G38_2077016 [Gigaspora rosea]|uniref:Ser-Thr-rich glycosyl-phosphatidyl-inositol-anchored membrane family-domain-containing protein n=1 Tax=Gigaspora rosea TaxID=44941 RepID=A0A397VKT1_9GLOM|nr:hypothetical protein C2G38_2077016 [Gigaspora rosea]